MSKPGYYTLRELLCAAGAPPMEMDTCYNVTLVVEQGGEVTFCCVNDVVYVDRVTRRGRLKYAAYSLWRRLTSDASLKEQP